MTDPTPDRARGPEDTAAPRRGRGVPVGDVVLAVDVSGSRCSVGLVTMQGELIDRDVAAIDADVQADALFAILQGLIDSQLERARGHHHVRPVAVGVGCDGPISPGCETVSPISISSWRNFPLRERLTMATMLPVYGDLDAKALALAEGWLGAAQGRESFMAITVSTGVGGGIVLNGQLLDGAMGNAGGIGHLIVEPNGRRCTCGARGCLEAEASGLAVEAITGRPPSSPTYEIMQRTGRLVGRAAASVCNLLDLDLVVVGGSVALGFGATFFNSAQETMDEHTKLAFSRGARITPVRLGEQGPLIGAGAVGVRGIHRARRAPRPAPVVPVPERGTQSEEHD
ncbi:MAG: ROK family protein [Ilumatobacteraceae bacterium]